MFSNQVFSLCTVVLFNVKQPALNQQKTFLVRSIIISLFLYLVHKTLVIPTAASFATFAKNKENKLGGRGRNNDNINDNNNVTVAATTAVATTSI